MQRIFRLRLRPRVALLLVFAFCTIAAAPGRPPRQLRVCADGNNLPFSDNHGAGFENKIAELIAADLGAKLSYVWAPQRRGFVRNGLNAGLCDVVVGLPAALASVRTSRPYYRSSYVFVFGPSAPRVTSLDDAGLRQLKIGVPLVGDDGANPAPVLALARRGLTGQVRGYSVYGDYRSQSPSAEIIRALRRKDIDLAIAWGPLAGYFANQGRPRLHVAPLLQAEAPPGLDFAFDISLGVRQDDTALLAELNRALARQKGAIDAVLARYSVPILR